MRCTAPLERQFVNNVYNANAYNAQAYTFQRNFSQKVARFFEIADYILLLPATLGLLYSLMLLPIGPIIIGGWYALGVLLLRGFRRHSRGQMSNDDAVKLWSFTFGYNLIELLVLIGVTGGTVNFLYVWPILVLQLLVTALIKDLRGPSPIIN
jgi:hypothetical protein